MSFVRTDVALCIEIKEQNFTQKLLASYLSIAACVWVDSSKMIKFFIKGEKNFYKPLLESWGRWHSSRKARASLCVCARVRMRNLP